MLRLVDRLVERGWIDRWGFIIFAFGGASGIVFAKALQAHSVVVAIGAALLIVAYAAIVQRSGTGRLRGDQAGDNCYYLGLIYTLASLAYAIFTFDPNDTATTIVQGFGVALATTIVGLVLRVFFNQTRADIVEVEDTARIELAEAAGRLRAELNQVVVSMNDFGRQTRQSMEELRGEMATTLKAQADEATARSKKLATATDKVVSGFERSADSMNEMETAQANLARSVVAVEQAASSVDAHFRSLAAQAEQLHSLQSGLNETVSSVSSLTARMVEQVQAFDGSAARVEQQMSDRLAEVKAVPTEIASSVVAGVESAMQRLDLSLTALVDRQEAASAQMISAVTRHNQELEAELAKSREHVSRVHSALVEMTGQLADRIEGQRP